MNGHPTAGPVTRYVTGDLAKALPLVAAVYFFAGRLGLAVPYTSGNVSPVWPAAGIALGAILLSGPRVWPAVAAGGFLVNLFTPVPAMSAFGMAIGNAAGPLAGAWMLRRTRGFDPCLGRLSDVIRLIVLGAFAGTAISATIGTASLALGRVPAWPSVRATWLMWWLGDAMGVLVVTPLVLAIPYVRAAPEARRPAELAALLLTTVACSLLVFRTPPELAGSSYGILALTFPFLLMWGATRFEVPGAALITASLATVALWESRYGLGPFVVGTSLQNAGLLQSFVTVIAVSGLSVAALTADRTRLIRQQAEREAARLGEKRYREIAEAANEGVWMLDSHLLTCFVNKRLTQTGGDYFDFIPAAGGVYVAIGDASGHGLGAALVMALTRAYVRSLTALNLDVAEILTRVNHMLLGDLEENRFVTLLLVQVDRAARRLRYANAGHVAGFVIGGGDPLAAPASMASTGMPLGLFSRSMYPARELALEPRQVVVLVTDGVTESEGHGEEFGAERLVAYARAHTGWPARSLARGICRSARRFARDKPQADDITSVVVKVTGLPGAGGAAAPLPRELTTNPGSYLNG